MDKVTLNFTEQQLDYITSVLGQRPYIEVAKLLSEIVQQIADSKVPAKFHQVSLQDTVQDK